MSDKSSLEGPLLWPQKLVSACPSIVIKSYLELNLTTSGDTAEKCLGSA
jgi:hypothetical protein